jgi:hypothetical protein
MGKVLTVPEVAAIAGWSRRRMLRHLLRVNERLGGMLLRNIGTDEHPRWTVTLDALQRVAPEWFTDVEALNARIEALELEVKKLRMQLGTVASVVTELTAA